MKTIETNGNPSGPPAMAQELGTRPREGHRALEQRAPTPVESEPVEIEPTESKPAEIGGPPGPEPTRYGDWEKNGRCIDF